MSLSAQIAIDIGTTYSRVAIFQDGEPLVLKNELANNLTPSYVAYTENLCHVGDQAKEISATSGADAIHSARRILGRQNDEQPFVKQLILNQHCKYVLIGGRPSLQVNYRKHAKPVTPEEVMALLVRKMVEIGDKALLGRKNAIITVPSQFDCHQRKAVKNAADIAGIDCRLINETTAAAIACAFEMKSEFTRQKRNLLVYNMGGGFTTATIVSVATNELSVLSTAGDMQLGGEDFDQALADHCCKQFEKKHKKKGLRENQSAMCKLKQACEKTKRSLSFSVRSTIRVEDLFAGNDFNADITREEFETLCGKLFERAMCPVYDVLSYARMKEDQIAEIILVGGSTRMPIIKQKLMTMFPQIRVNSSVNQDEAAVLGAAICAGIPSFKFQDVIPTAFGVEKTNGVPDFVCMRNDQFPHTFCRVYKVEDFSSKYSRSPLVKLTVLNGRGTYLNHFSLKKGINGNSVKLGFFVDFDGILAMEADVAGAYYPELFPSERGSLTKKEIETIKVELARYSKHKAADSKRIIVKDAKDVLVSCVEKLSVKLRTEKLSDAEYEDYSGLRDKLSKWIAASANATTTECEIILEDFSKRVVEIKQKHALDKLPAVTKPSTPKATDLGVSNPSKFQSYCSYNFPNSANEVKVQPAQGNPSFHANLWDKKNLSPVHSTGHPQLSNNVAVPSLPLYPVLIQSETQKPDGNVFIGTPKLNQNTNQPTQTPPIENNFVDMQTDHHQGINTNQIASPGWNPNMIAKLPNPTLPMNATSESYAPNERPEIVPFSGIAPFDRPVQPEMPRTSNNIHNAYVLPNDQNVAFVHRQMPSPHMEGRTDDKKNQDMHGEPSKINPSGAGQPRFH